MTSKDEGDFIFAQTAYKFDVSLCYCCELQKTVASFNGPVKHYDHLVKRGLIIDDPYQVFVFFLFDCRERLQKSFKEFITT